MYDKFTVTSIFITHKTHNKKSKFLSAYLFYFSLDTRNIKILFIDGFQIHMKIKMTTNDDCDEGGENDARCGTLSLSNPFKSL
jgi:hypothetical protein